MRKMPRCADGRHLADVHYTRKRVGDRATVDPIVGGGEQALDRCGEVTLETQEGHKLACTPEAPAEGRARTASQTAHLADWDTARRDVD